MWAVIAGSGFEQLESVHFEEVLPRETPFGECSSGFSKMRFYQESFLFLPRHGAGHELPPSEINYLANLFALKDYGVSKILSLSAVGSLREEIQPGSLVVPDQFIDQTKRRMDTSFTSVGVVGHVSLADPIWKSGKDGLVTVQDEVDAPIHFGKTLVCIEGPYYSTRAESLCYRQMGADIINMTSFPEYALARELGLCYLPVCFVTDFDCWNPENTAVTVQEVMSHTEANQKIAEQILSSLFAQNPPLDEETLEGSLQHSLMTDWEAVPGEDKQWLRKVFR